MAGKRGNASAYYNVVENEDVSAGSEGELCPKKKEDKKKAATEEESECLFFYHQDSNTKFEKKANSETIPFCNEDRTRSNYLRMSKTDDEVAGTDDAVKRPLFQTEKSSCNCCLSKQCAYGFAKRIFPFLTILKGYSLVHDFPGDLIAGLTTGIMHIPQGMAYALLARLPPVYGLYASFYPGILYFFFGSSRHISVGTFGVACLMVGTAVERGQAMWEQERNFAEQRNVTSAFDTNINATNSSIVDEELNIKVSYAMSISFAVGIMQIILGVVRFGFLVSFLSDPLISGFITAAAIQVASTQLTAISGVHVGRYSGPFKLIYWYRDFFLNLNKGNWTTVLTSVVSILILVAVREGINNNKHCARLRVPVPIELIMIVAATLLSYYLDLEKRFDVNVIGYVPTGLPAVDVTVLRFVPNVLAQVPALCLTIFTVSFALAKILAARHEYQLDANQELFALGMTNTIGPLFSSFCCAGSMSRSILQDEVGGKTQISSLIASCLVLFVLLVIGPLFETLPTCILAVIIWVSLKRIFMQFGELKRLWHVSKTDFTVWLVAFISTLLLDVDIGLLVGVIYNLLPILFRIQRPYTSLLGKMEGTEMYADIKVHPEAREVPGVKIFRFEAPLYFANVERFRSCLEKETGVNVKDLQQSPHTAVSGKDQQKAAGKETEKLRDGYSDYKSISATPSETSLPVPSASDTVRAIVVDGSVMQYLDSAAARVLREIIKEYQKVEIDVFLAACKPTVWSVLDKSGLYDHVPRRHMCGTVHQAVSVALQSTSQYPQDISSSEDDVSSSAGLFSNESSKQDRFQFLSEDE